MLASFLLPLSGAVAAAAAEDENEDEEDEEWEGTGSANLHSSLSGSKYSFHVCASSATTKPPFPSLETT